MNPCLCNTGSLQYHIPTYIGLPCRLTPHAPFYYYYYSITIISLFSNSFLFFSSYSPTASNKRCVVPPLTTFFHCFWLQTCIIYPPSKTRYWRKDKGRDAEEGEVSSYQMTLRKRDYIGISKRNQQIALSGELALEKDHGPVVPKTTQ